MGASRDLFRFPLSRTPEDSVSSGGSLSGPPRRLDLDRLARPGPAREGVDGMTSSQHQTLNAMLQRFDGYDISHLLKQ
jgi:hypothetical protein